MNPFQEKYHQTKGTHCWFCDRAFTEKMKITREHIIPKSKIIYNYSKNYIASCKFCNGFKGSGNAKDFAMKIDKTIAAGTHTQHHMYKYFKLISQRAWKLYNKTSNLHKNYKTLRLIN